MSIPFFAYIAAFSHGIPAVAGTYQWSGLNNTMKFFSGFCWFAVLIEIIEFVTGKLGIHNQVVINFYRLIEFGAILFIYYKSTNSRLLRSGILFIGLGYFVLWSINKFFYEDPLLFGNTITTVALFLLIAVSIIILHYVIRSSRNAVTQQSIFWIASGVLLYSSGTIIVWNFSNRILAMGIDYFNILWHINWGFTIIANIFYTRSLWCKIF